MASVTGVTAERAQEIWDSSIVSGAIDQLTGRLVFKNRRGDTVDGGSIINPSLQKAYPIGSIFFTVDAANPKDSIGFGIWERWAVGRMPIGIDESNVRYNSVGDIGGSESITLTAGQSGLRDHNHGGATYGSTVNMTYGTSNAVGTNGGYYAKGGGGAEVAGQANTNHAHGIPNSGWQNASEAHENMPPFIACFIWKRTA